MSLVKDSDPLIGGAWTRVDNLAGDASVRRYSRLSRPNGQTAVLVEYPADSRGDFERDLEVLSWFRGIAIRVPEVIAIDRSSFRAVVSDLGREDVAAALVTAGRAARRELLSLALEPLQKLAGVPPAELPPWNPPLGRERLRWELAGFELWFVRHLRGRIPDDDASRWLDDLAERISSHPLRICHRDYHLNNLLIQGGRVGVIDVQDVLVGPDTYDIVSLLWERSAGEVLDRSDREWALGEWARQTEATSGWRERAALVRIQRGLKVLGSFARFVAGGNERYRPWLDGLRPELAKQLIKQDVPQSVTDLLLD